jgi:hypothetical protein
LRKLNKETLQYCQFFLNNTYFCATRSTKSKSDYLKVKKDKCVTNDTKSKKNKNKVKNVKSAINSTFSENIGNYDMTKKCHPWHFLWIFM